MEKWTYFTIHQKSLNSISFLLIIGRTSKQHKGMPQNVFHQITKALGKLLGMVCVHSIRGINIIDTLLSNCAVISILRPFY